MHKNKTNFAKNVQKMFKMFKKFYIQSKNENENPQNQFPEFS